MGIFSTKRSRCKRRCDATFPNMKSMRSGCRNMCDSNKGFNAADYPCKVAGFDEQKFIINYGYDPCKGNATTVDSVFGITDKEQGEKERQEGLMELVKIAGAIIVVALIILLVIAL